MEFTITCSKDIKVLHIEFFDNDSNNTTKMKGSITSSFKVEDNKPSYDYESRGLANLKDKMVVSSSDEPIEKPDIPSVDGREAKVAATMNEDF